MQPLNASEAISSSESGNSSEVTAAPWNAESPMVFSPLPKVTEASAEQFENACSPMLSSESGKASEVTAVL